MSGSGVNNAVYTNSSGSSGTYTSIDDPSFGYEYAKGMNKQMSLSTSEDSGIGLQDMRQRKPGGIRFMNPADEGEEMGLTTDGYPATGRRKSQWGAYLENTDMKKVMASGTFKLTLLQLARDGEANTLKYLLDNLGHNQCSRMLNSATDEEGATALHLASKNNHYGVCKLLIDSGANVNIRTGETRATPLHYAARRRPKRSARNHVNANIPPRQQSVDGPSVIGLLSDRGAGINDSDIEGQTALHLAAIKGNLTAVHQLLACKDVDLEKKDGQGMAALHIAATHGHLEIVRALIAKGAGLFSADNDLMTPFHFACADGNVEVVRMLLNKALSDGPAQARKMLHCLDAGKNTGLHIAASKGHMPIVMELLARLPNPHDAAQMVNSVRSHGDSSLHIAAAQGHLDICNKLIVCGADIEARNHSLATPLILAAQHNNFEVIESLVEKGAEMESRDKDNLTPLLLACKHGHLETLSWLIDHDADCTATDKHDKTCLMLAVEEQRTAAVHELLSYDAVLRLMDETDKNTNSVLHIAARKGFIPIIKVLLDHGARGDSKNEDEATSLHIAAQFGQHFTLKELLEHDRNNINAVDENANTAIHLAAIEGHSKCVKTLIDNGANVGLRNTRQMTPLDCAASKGWEASVLVLLEAKSAINPIKGSRTTPLHEACLNGHAQVVKLLLRWRADVDSKIGDGRNPLDCAIDQDNDECVQAILQHTSWKQALRNAYVDPITEQVITPIRKMVVKMPEMAEVAFSRSITDNRKKWDDEKLEVKLDFEFLDDTYTIPEWLHKGKELEEESAVGTADTVATNVGAPLVIYQEGRKSPSKRKNSKIAVPEDPANYDAFNDHGKLNKSAITYSTDLNMLRRNHPLMIMVSRKREGLLQHPVVTALLQHKWDKYGGLVYYTTLLFLVAFVILLNCYMILIPPPYTVDFLKSLANRRFYIEFTAEHLINYTAPSDCYSMLRSGSDYRGYVSLSASNKTCINWDDTSTDSFLYPDSGLDSNYCRNPGSLLERPWCFTNYSSTDPDFNVRDECDVPMCNVYAIGGSALRGSTCVFPFIYEGAENFGCIEESGDRSWCSTTKNYVDDRLWGYCKESDPYCQIPDELKKTCGSAGIDQLNCEARGCCYITVNEGQPDNYSECIQRFDECSDWDSYCGVRAAAGECESNIRNMFNECPLACGFCNVTERVEDPEQQLFLYLMSTYPTATFDQDWQEGCYYCLPGAEKKWGANCRYQQSWERPVRITLMALCVFNLVGLILQIWNYRLEAFNPVFFLETLLYVLCLVLVIDLNTFDLEHTRQMQSESELYHPLVSDFQKETGLRQNWQWQCGVSALFLSWMNLLLYIQKIPYLGIYVVMFRDIFTTFSKFSIVFLLFIFSFAFTFHTLLQNESEFEFPFQSILKATVMMVGELDFTGLFLGGSDVYEEKVNYIILTYILFLIFIIVMMIIIMNLLVGLAVGDIMEVQEHATLERLKMQVELALEVEFSVPNAIRKYFVRQFCYILPNRYRSCNALTRALFENKSLSTKKLAGVLTRDQSENEEMQETMTQLVTHVRDLKTKTTDHDSVLKDLLTEMKEMRSIIEETADLQKQKINMEEEERASTFVKKDSDATYEHIPAFRRTASSRWDYRSSVRRLRASQRRRDYMSAESIRRDDESLPAPIPIVPSAPVSPNDTDEVDKTESPPASAASTTGPSITLSEFNDMREYEV